MTAYRRIFLAAQSARELHAASRQLDTDMADLDLLGLWEPIAQPSEISTSIPLLPPAMNDNSPAPRLIQAFVQHALAHAEAKTHTDSQQVTSRLSTLARELRALEPEGRAAVVELTTHADASVRLWAAIYGLDTAPYLCVSILEALSVDAPEPVRTDAAITLREWRAGRWQLP